MDYNSLDERMDYLESCPDDVSDDITELMGKSHKNIERAKDYCRIRGFAIRSKNNRFFLMTVSVNALLNGLADSSANGNIRDYLRAIGA